MIKKRILFIEAEPARRERLEQGLVNRRDRWDLTFVGTSAEARRQMDRTPVDAIVADAYEPGASVVEFLKEVLTRFPKTLRFIRLDHAEKGLIRNWTGSPPCFLPKECEVEKIEDAIEREFQLELWLANGAIKKLIPQLEKSPSLPELYHRIFRELQFPDANLEEVGLLMANDPALCAKLLQMVNSPFFGLSRQVTSAFEAVMYLGIEQVKALVLYSHCASLFEPGRCRAFSIDRLWSHCMTTAAFSRWISLEANGNGQMADEAFTAGLLHDLGKLRLAANLPDSYGRALALADQKRITEWEAEKEVFGATHAELGACLLGMWGLPLSILEAVAWHHNPSRSGIQVFSTLTAVHVANALACEKDALKPDQPISQIDAGYLTTLGMSHRCEPWRRICGLPECPPGA